MDYVITTRELAEWAKEDNIDLEKAPEIAENGGFLDQLELVSSG